MLNPISHKIYTKSGIVKEDVFVNKKVLHLGCGNSKLKGAIGVDRLSLADVDIVQDLDKKKWAFEDSSYDIVFAQSLVEHIDDLVGFFEEVWRIGKNGARVVIGVPYFRSIDSFADPTHRHFFTARSMDYFIDGTKLSNYSYSSFKFEKIGFWYGWPQRSNNLLVNYFKSFILGYSKFYDQYLSLIFPVKILVWELEVKK